MHAKLFFIIILVQFCLSLKTYCSESFINTSQNIQVLLAQIQTMKNKIEAIEYCLDNKNKLENEIIELEELKNLYSDVLQIKLSPASLEENEIRYDERNQLFVSLEKDELIAEIEQVLNIINKYKNNNIKKIQEIWTKFKMQPSISSQDKSEFFDLTSIKLENPTEPIINEGRTKLIALTMDNKVILSKLQKKIINEIASSILRNKMKLVSNYKCSERDIANIKENIDNVHFESSGDVKEIIEAREQIDNLWKDIDNIEEREVLEKIVTISRNRIQVLNLPDLRLAKPLVCHSYAAFDAAKLTEEIFLKLELEKRRRFDQVSSGDRYVKKILNFFNETKHPKEGDLVIYLDLSNPKAEEIFYAFGNRPHSAIYIDENFVKSSWGGYANKLFIHPTFMVPSKFGSGVLYLTLKDEYKGPGVLSKAFCSD